MGYGGAAPPSELRISEQPQPADLAVYQAEHSPTTPPGSPPSDVSPHVAAARLASTLPSSAALAQQLAAEAAVSHVT